MKADAITAKILDDARKAAADALRDAHAREAAMTEKAEADNQAMREKSMQQARKNGAEQREKMLRMAELDQRKELLAVKRRVIDEAFENALEKLRTMPADRAHAFLTRMILDSAQGGEEIVVADADRALYSDSFLQELNQKLAAAGKKPVVLAAESRPLDGGLILKMGGMEVNCTYRAMLGQIRPTLEAEVADILFK